MLDIIDLMNEHFYPKLYEVTDGLIELNFKNKIGNNESSSTMTNHQLHTLQMNVASLHKLLTEEIEGSQYVGFKQKTR